MEESINESDAAPVAAETTPVPASPSKKKHSVTGLIKEMWPAYLIEIIVIILGISITLALEQWRDNSKEKQLEKVYLQNLLTDVQVDLDFLKSVSASTGRILGRGNELLNYIRNPGTRTISSGQVNMDVRALLGRPRFLSQDATFSDLKSSGNLHLLKDIRLKNLLFDYYNRTQNIKEMQDAEQQATITISGAYFLKRFQLDDGGSRPELSDTENLNNLLKSIEFENNVLLRVSNRNELQEIYQKTIIIATELKNELIRCLRG
jgi:hypothetical protein